MDWTNGKARLHVNQAIEVENLPKAAAGIRDVDLSETHSPVSRCNEQHCDGLRCNAALVAHWR